MKLLLDENLPIKLKYRLRDVGHDAFTVREMNWITKQNGELLQLILSKNFECLLTLDTSIAFQQNFKQYPIPIIILKGRTSQYEDLILLIPKIATLLEKPLKPGPCIIDYHV